jgi:hypothetical protein
VHNRVGQVLLLLRCRMAVSQVSLRLLLHSVSILPAVLDALPAQAEAGVDLSQRFVSAVEAMHAAPRTLEVHDVELSVQEGVEPELTSQHSLLGLSDHPLSHVRHHGLIIRDLEDLLHFLEVMVLALGKVNLGFLLYLLVASVFLKPPWFQGVFGFSQL